MTELPSFHDLFDSSVKVAPQERGVSGTYRDESKLYNLSKSVKTGTVPTLNSPYHPDELLEEPVSQAAEQIALACEYEEAHEETTEEEVEKERPWIIPNTTYTETNTVQHPQVVRVPPSKLARQAIKPIEDYVSDSDSNSLPNPKTLEAYGHLLSETARRGLTKAAQGENDISRVRYEDKTGSKQLEEPSRFFESGPPLGVLVEEIQEEASSSTLYDEEADILVDSFESETESNSRILQ